MRRYLLALCSAGLIGNAWAVPPKGGAAESETQKFGQHAHGLVGSVEKETTRQKQKLAVFKGFGRYKKYFQSICLGLYADGREEKFLQVVTPFTQRTPDCIACAPLAKGFTSSCKGSRVAKKDTSGRGKAPPKQREPHIQLCQMTAETFRAIADDRDIQTESLLAVQRLVGALRDPNGKTAGEAEYFELLSGYMDAPFRELVQQKAALEAADQPTLKQQTPATKLEDLF